MAGRYDVLHTALSAYGDPLGEAFQLRDDMLGAFGEESLTGKPVGDDLREGKPTPLLAVATARADAAQQAVLERVGSAEISDPDVAAIQAVLIETGAVDEMEASIDRLTTYAIAAIEQAPVTAEASTALVELAQFVAWRDK